MTRMAIEKNRVTAVALLFLAVAGVMSYLSLPRSEDPGFIIRTATVVTYFPGASPARVEQLVTDKLEKAIQEMPELDVLRSNSKTGVSVIFVDIQERYTNMRPIWDKLRRKVEKATTDLPGGIIGPTVNDEFGDVFGILMMLTGDGFTYRELKDVADAVRDELLLIEDVAKVEIFGAQDERLFVEYSNARLAELGLSPTQLQQILASRNIIIPGGDITTPYEKIVLEPSGNFESVDALRRTVINLPNSRDVVYLEDLVSITRGYIDPPTRKMRCAGEPCLGLAVSMREGGNIVELGERVKVEMSRIESYYPIGIEFDYVQFQPEAVEKKVNEFVNSLLQAVGIVALVMLITLGLRTGLVVASLIPMAMLMSLLVMSFLDIGLDQMSLASLIIALGMLVDNAIVMSESIMVQMAAGRPRVEAAVSSANELKIPLLTSSLTTAAAFLPIFLAESSTGEYTAPLFKVVTITLLCSWVLSLTMVPLFCVAFLNVKISQEESTFDSRFYRLYRGFLIGILRLRWLFVIVVVGVFVLAIKGFDYIPAIFFPANDRPTFSADIELPVGTPIERTEKVVRELEQFVQQQLLIGPERPTGVTNWAAFIGEGAPRYILSYGPEQASPSYAYMLFNATSPWIMDDLIEPLEAFANANFPDLKATIRPLELGPPAWPPVAVRISGRDPETLFDIVDRVKAKLREIPGTKLIDDNWGARSKKIVVNVNEARARRAGVTNQDVAISLQTFLSGLETTEYREGDKLIPVTLRSVEAERKDLAKLETLNVYVQATGQSVPLTQVADIEVVWEPATIQRRNRLKTVTVEAGLEPGYTAVETNAILQPWLEKQQTQWPLGYGWSFGGEAETSGDANESIGVKLPIAGLIIVLLLVGQFNSIRRPIIILLTIPLGIIGVVIGLLATKLYFGFMTLLGIISLAGIVINNAIVLLDRIRIEIEDNGLEPARAIIESAQRRLRPILLTTCTTIGGLIPLWLGGGPMWEPMAVSIIFGLLFATVLTLGVVPVLYAIFFRVRFRGFRYEAL
ncbi:efflux RND transporter permease subunit [Candidatus Entotheonella palauensis]|uniref:efflux RND transporter permease subunit n=1 Tax=Candidatus Entotheonella palauensis TaxID=93172 RepID=UPI00277B5A53|nr:efflux RND transporter permease subunit [Candidatus Entotheonella palauensis]